MSDSIKWLQEIEDIPARAVDPLADEVMRRFNGAVAWQSTEQVNGKSLKTVLQECWEQQNGILACEDLKRAKAIGVDAIVNITALKVGIANAYLTDSLTSGTSELPWIIQPTPRPDISPQAKEELLQELKRNLFANQFPDGPAMVGAIREGKKVLARREKDKADKAAKEMMLLIEDQCAEGGLDRTMTDFIQYLPAYPYAVFSGPYVSRAPRLVWGKRKPRMSTEVFPAFRSINPFDFCYSPDSPDTQRGTCVFTRTLWTRKELIDAAKLNSYLQRNVLEVLEEADTNSDFNLSWMSRSPDSPRHNLGLWSSNVAPLEVLTHYGVMSGRELGKYGFNGLDSTEFYECEIAMAGYRVIQVKVMSDPRMKTRPIYTASFYKTGGDRIAGDGIAQRLRDIERAYHASLRYLMRNAANASAPMCEADYRRVIKHMGENDIGNIVPGLMYMADSDVANSGRPALQFFNIPSNMPAYVQLMEMFMQLADRITNIPASLHGEAVGSGAMRTFRGMSMLQGNATRALHAAVGNIADGVFRPLGQYLYNLNMLYSSSPDVKGDSQIITKGAEGILQKEIDKQQTLEALEVMIPFVQALAGVSNITPAVMYALYRMLGSLNIPDDIRAQVLLPPPNAGNEGGVPPGTGGGVQNPNPNPGSPTGGGYAADVGVPMTGAMNDAVT